MGFRGDFVPGFLGASIHDAGTPRSRVEEVGEEMKSLDADCVEGYLDPKKYVEEAPFIGSWARLLCLLLRVKVNPQR